MTTNRIIADCAANLPNQPGPPQMSKKDVAMRRDQIKEIFDQQASRYDVQWAKAAPIRDCLYFLLDAVFAELPTDSRIICVGAGTGEEMTYLAKRFPFWSFVAVEPSCAMLDVCRNKAIKEGFISRCYFHEGYLESLPIKYKFDAATCFLVSQFIQEQDVRSGFFREIAEKLRPDGLLASSDLASEVGSPEYETLLQVWLNMMAGAGIPPEGLERMRAAYAKDVAILPPDAVASIMKAGGFSTPVTFFQAGLIHAWYARCASE
jgi:tRNA (cmo5U34)-methyltransferase